MERKIMILAAVVFAAATVVAQTPTTLGIGISNPQGNLHVHSMIEDYVPVPGINGDNMDAFHTDYFGIYRMTNGNTGTTSSDGFSIKQYNYDLTFTQHEDGYVLWKLPNNGKVWMLRGGRVGIGDTTAGYKLSVAGAAKVSGRLNVGGSITAGDTLKLGNVFRVLSNGSTTIHGSLMAADNKFMVYSTGDVFLQNQLNVANKVFLFPNGDIRVDGGATIGNGFYCDATGHLKVKELRVTLTDWPDYVFDPGYSLMPLGEVEKYICEIGHLPQMPSATEVERDGANIGEVNRLLLQKVEELTLYIIDLQKQIDELKSDK